MHPAAGEGVRGGDSGRGSVTSDILTQCALCGQQYTEPRVGPADAASAIYQSCIYIIAASAVSPHLLLELSVELHSQVTDPKCRNISNFSPMFSSSLTISCPLCGHTSILPPEGVSGNCYE